MSAIIDPYRNCGVDGLRRYNTRIKVLVHSHNHRQPIELSDDVVNCVVGKNLKGTGKANLAVVARLNYLNMIFPNDYVNIYFDIGDGSGWTRTFFGLVDRIEEDYTVDASGAPTTMYHIIASDFSKIFLQTNIYFNPHLFSRFDVHGEDYNALNIGGIALQTRGVHVKGSPADCVLNQILIQIGFGSQWKVPNSYQVRVDDRFANQRSQYAKGRLFTSLQNSLSPEQSGRLQAIVDGSGYNSYRTDTEGELTTALRENAGADLDSENAQTRTTAALRATGLNATDLQEAEYITLTSSSRPEDIARVLANPRIRQQIFGSGLTPEQHSFAQEQLNQYASAETAARRTTTIVEVMNLFDFVERRAIDGFAFDISIWEKQGPLLNILMALSNEPINELFFDLRPMTLPPDGSVESDVFITAGTGWDRSGDEISGNLRDETNFTDGIRYMPSVVMREYPFSTVREVDASNVEISLSGSDGDLGNLGKIYFGGVFSNLPNAPGRHLVRSPILNVEERIQGSQPGNNRTYKHLDVAVMSETEIRSSRWGRSDADHFNLFEMFSDDLLGTDARYFMYDFLPIITPVHIMRHGLRTRTTSTRFGRFSIDTANRTQPQAAPTEEQQQSEEEAVTPATTDDAQEFRFLVSPPVAAAPGLRFRNAGEARYGYRKRDLPKRMAEAIVDAEPGSVARARAVRSASKKNRWGWHAGIDIGGRGPEYPFSGRNPAIPWEIQGRGDVEGPTDIVAIADGLVVGVYPQNVMNWYGNYVVVYHPQFVAPEDAAVGSPKGRVVFSCYAHMANIEPSVLALIGSARTRSRCGHREYINGGRGTFEPMYVRKGQKLGTMGQTEGRNDNENSVFQHGRSHLHFEINFHVPPKNPTAVPEVPYTVAGNPVDEAIPELGLPAGPRAPVQGDRPNGVNPYGTDPVAWYNSINGGDLEAEIQALAASAGTDPTEGDDEENDGERGDAADSDVESPPSRVEQGAPMDEVQETLDSQQQQQITGKVDSITTRQQLGRWALLQDHWYQHNLEYVSGQLTTRPAPEVRVGYRLDLLERRMSFYVEGVQHTWNFPNEMTTSIQVTRGQPNNPFPAYALPPLDGFRMPRDARRETSRLANYFIVPDPIAVRRAISLRSHRAGNTVTHDRATGSNGINDVDLPQFFETFGYAEAVGGSEGLLGASSIDFGGTEDGIMRAVEITGLDEDTIRAILNGSGIGTEDDFTYTEAPQLSSATGAGEGVDANLINNHQLLTTHRGDL